MKPKTKRIARRTLSWLLTTSIILGIISIGQFTIFAAELSGYANETIVRFKNAGSGKYLNVHNGVTINGTNVYQWTYDGSEEQTFRLKYNRDKDCYLIRTMCSSDNSEKVLDIVKSGGNVVAGCNVQIYSPVATRAQEWQFEYYGEGKFAIFPVVNIYTYLTAISNSNGTGSGTTSTSAGNVCLTAHEMSSFAEPTDNQLWYIEEVENKRTIADGYYKIDNNYDKYITAKLNLCSVYQRDSHNSKDQIWHVEYLYNGYYSIRSAEDARFAVRVCTSNSHHEQLGAYLDLYELNSSQSMVLYNYMMWKIVPNAAEGTYRIVSKSSYDNQVITAMSDDDNNSLFAQVPYVDADTQKWKITPAQCPKQGQTEHAKGHCLQLNQNDSYYVWYTCAICNAFFKTPQEQDHENSALSDEDRVALYALQNAALLFNLEGNSRFAESCMRAADVIRTQYNGLFVYDFSDTGGNYYSPIAYSYTASTIGTNVRVSTFTHDEMQDMEQELVWAIGSVLPHPLDAIYDTIENLAETGKWYSVPELLKIFAISGIKGKTLDNWIDSKDETLNVAYYCTQSASLIKTTTDFTIPTSSFEKDISLEICVRDANRVSYLHGSYRMDNTTIDNLHIIDESFDANHQASGTFSKNILMMEYNRDSTFSRDGWTLFST